MLHTASVAARRERRRLCYRLANQLLDYVVVAAEGHQRMHKGWHLIHGAPEHFRTSSLWLGYSVSSRSKASSLSVTPLSFWHTSTPAMMILWMGRREAPSHENHMTSTSEVSVIKEGNPVVHS